MRKRRIKMAGILVAMSAILSLAAGCGGAPAQAAPEPPASATGAGAASSAPEENFTYPADVLNYYVAASAGGGLDIISRCFTNEWESALDTTFEYIYEDTGNTYLIGMNDLNSLDEDEFGVLCGIPEAMLGMFEFQDSTYTAEDIAWIGNIVTDANCLMVRIDDDRFNSASDLIEYARDPANMISISTPQSLTPANIAARVFADASGINANVVPYNGGSGARNDLIGGHVDVSVGGVSTAVGLTDQVKIIGIFGSSNPVSDIWPDAQIISDFATDFEMPELTSHYSIWTTVEMKEKNPEVYEKLCETFAEAIQSDAAASNLKAANQDRFIDYRNADETAKAAGDFAQVLTDYSALLDPSNA